MPDKSEESKNNGTAVDKRARMGLISNKEAKKTSREVNGNEGDQLSILLFFMHSESRNT